VRDIEERLAFIQNRAQELDPGGPAGRALWCIDALCDLISALVRRVEIDVLTDLHARVVDLEQEPDVGVVVDAAIKDHDAVQRRLLGRIAVLEQQIADHVTGEQHR